MRRRRNQLALQKLPLPTATTADHRKPLFQTLPWQAELWEMRRTVGELRFLESWLQNALEQVYLYPAEVDSHLPVQRGAVKEIADQVAGGVDGVRALLARWAGFYLFPGESYLAIISRPSANRFTSGGVVAITGNEQDGYQEWYLLPASAIVKHGDNRIELDLPSYKHTFSPANDTLLRIYSPDPENPQNADSALRAALSSLREIRASDTTLAHALRSRVVGATILVTPNDVNFPDPSQAPVAEDIDPDAPNLPSQPQQVDATEGEQTLQKKIFDALQITADDPDSVAAFMPVIVGTDSNYADAFRVLKLGEELSDTALKIREAAVRRVALASDFPPEVLLGIGSVNHWGGGVVQKEAHRHAIAPARLLADALTRALFRPALEDAGIENPEKYHLAVDATTLILNTDRTESAIALFDREAINRDALSQALGFDPKNDLPRINPNSKKSISDWALHQIESHPDRYAVYYHLVDPPLPAPIYTAPLDEKPDMPGDANPVEEPETDATSTEIQEEQTVVVRNSEPQPDRSPRGTDSSRANRKQSNQGRIN